MAGTEQGGGLLHDGLRPWARGGQTTAGHRSNRVLVIDQNAEYRFIDTGQRQLRWAHVDRNITTIGARLVLLADAVFHSKARYISDTAQRIKLFSKSVS